MTAIDLAYDLLPLLAVTLLAFGAVVWVSWERRDLP